jgi:hypothetical protein
VLGFQGKAQLEMTYEHLAEVIWPIRRALESGAGFA